jgi:hypothetical protein
MQYKILLRSYYFQRIIIFNLPVLYIYIYTWKYSGLHTIDKFLTWERDNEKVTLMKMPVPATMDQLKHTNFTDNMKILIELLSFMNRRSTFFHSVVCHIRQKLSNSAMIPSELTQHQITKHSHLVENDLYYLLSAAKLVALKVCKWWKSQFSVGRCRKLYWNYQVFSCNSQIFFSNRTSERIRRQVSMLF